MPTQEVRFTHVSNFYGNVYGLLASAWAVHLQNLESASSSSGRVSHSESGDSALSILIMVIKLESDLRSKYDEITNGSDPNSSINPVILMENLVAGSHPLLEVSFVDKYSDYMKELLLVRNIIAHGYIFQGSINFDDNWSITDLDGSNITGRDRSRVGEDGRTAILKIETSPYKIGVFHAITVYRLIEVIRLMTGTVLGSRNILHDGSYITMNRWLRLANDGMSAERQQINDLLGDEYYSVMASNIVP